MKSNCVARENQDCQCLAATSITTGGRFGKLWSWQSLWGLFAYLSGVTYEVFHIRSLVSDLSSQLGLKANSIFVSSASDYLSLSLRVFSRRIFVSLSGLSSIPYHHATPPLLQHNPIPPGPPCPLRPRHSLPSRRKVLLIHATR